MIEELSSCIMYKELKQYAWTLYSGLADGTVKMTDLVKMVFHCWKKEENIVAAFIMTDFFSESRDGTLEELKRWERTSPSCSDPGEVAHHLGEYTWEAYAYDYLESSIPNVSSELHSASERVEEAQTFAEAVYAAIEYEFWLEITLTLPYTAYLLLTGQIS